MIYSELEPAKINLFLDVSQKRPDGYHDIGTLFQTIDTGDRLRAEADSSGEIRLSYDLPQEYALTSDLVYKAAVLLKETYGVRAGVRLHLQKHLPLGAGLGGGSADAAAALRLLNRVWGLGLGLSDLERLGARLGADVPFLVAGGSALASGIGDVLRPILPVELPQGAVLVVATPHCAVPTVAAYAGIIPSGFELWELFEASCLHNKAINPMDSSFDLFNKFEESVLPSYPQIAELRNRFLNRGAVRTLMSGSGASVFAFYENRALAEKSLTELKSLVRWGCVTRLFFPNIAFRSAGPL